MNEQQNLAEIRNIALDAIATAHMIAASEEQQEWICNCHACEYLRTEPRLVDAVQKSLARNKEQRQRDNFLW